MDLLSDIRRKIASLSGSRVSAGLEAVLRHIEMADAHLRRAIEEPNDDLFNDVIYRANQAYEGVLKEAWQVIHGAPAKKKTHELEKDLQESGALTERAKKLLENYRQEWRNPTTHEHTLFLGEQDAFLAIVSVLAFVSVLTDQIVEQVASDQQANELAPADFSWLRTAHLDADADLLPAAIERYARRPDAFFNEKGRPRSEAELLGRLGAFLRGAAPEVELERDPTLPDGRRPDLVMRQGDRTAILEVHRARPDSSMTGLEGQLFEYMEQARATMGFLVIPPEGPNVRVTAEGRIFISSAGLLSTVVVIKGDGYGPSEP